MEKFLSPETIYSGVKSKEISRNIAIEHLISLIEGSNIPKIRSKSISILNKLMVHDPKVFKIIENSLLSDESPFVRSSAMYLIGCQFLKEGLDTLTWVVQHEKSPLVIKTIFDLNLDLTDTRIKSLNKELNNYLEIIALTLGILNNEARFILDLEAIFALTKENYKLELGSYKFFTKLKDQRVNEFWLTIKNEHIESLSFNFFNWSYLKQNPDLYDSISHLQDPLVYLKLLRKSHLDYLVNVKIPESVALLTNLKKLNLSDNGIRELPKSIFFLSKLKYLDLSHNILSEIPEEITMLNSLKTLRIHNNDISRIPKTVNVYLEKLNKLKV
jgi:hypothetical protein